MHNAVATAQRYEQFIAYYGNDPFIAKTISKMVATRLSELQKELKRVQTGIARFEQMYGKTSTAFMQEFQGGTAGDSLDAIEWASLIQMADRLLAERTALQGN